jgi:SAM-dependent methyltransferase
MTSSATPPPDHAEGSVDAILERIARDVAARETATSTQQRPHWAPRVQTTGSAVAIPSVYGADEDALIDDTRGHYGLAEFLGMSDVAFVHTAYRILLGRPVDESGLASMLAGLSSGRLTRHDALDSLRTSEEGRARSVTIAGLDRRLRLERMAKRRYVGRFLAPLIALIHLRTDLSAVERRLSDGERRQRAAAASVNAALSAVRRAVLDVERIGQSAIGGMDSAILAAERAEHVATGAVAELNGGRAVLGQHAASLGKLIDAAKAALPEASGAHVAAIEDHALDDLYLAFENKFRGTRAEISRRSERYLPVIGRAAPIAAGLPVLDIGCGRGEWLAQLKGRGIAAKGVDLNVAMVEESRRAGHDVFAGDAIAYLRDQPAGSLGAVTGFHIIEHIPFAALVALLDAAQHALAPGGVILFETPNPECLVVGACTFYLDPTHRNPLPPEYSRFMAEARGFTQVRIIRQETDCDLDQPESGFSPEVLNDWFRLPTDYAVYGQKA